MSQDKTEKERLRKYSERDKLLALRETAIETNEPIKATRLWRYNKNIILTLGTDDNLYRITGKRHFRLKTLEQPLDKGWADYVNLSKQDIEFMNAISEIAKAEGMTPKQALELTKEDDKIIERMKYFSHACITLDITTEQALNIHLKGNELEIINAFSELAKKFGIDQSEPLCELRIT